MPKLKLTKTNIDRVRKPGAGTIIYVDTETKGFGLRVTASGAASFVVQGMVKGQSKERRITIGTYGLGRSMQRVGGPKRSSTSLRTASIPLLRRSRTMR